MQARYSGRSRAIAFSIDAPSSFDSSSSSGDSPPLVTVTEGARALGCHRVWRSFDADSVELTAAEMIDRDVVRDLEQPAREFELGPISVDVVQYLDEGFLREVLGGLIVAHHAVYEREHGSLIALDQLAIGVLTPFLGEDDHLLVGYVGVGPCWHGREARER